MNELWLAYRRELYRLMNEENQNPKLTMAQCETKALEAALAARLNATRDAS